MKKVIISGVFFFLLLSCGIEHNIPTNEPPNEFKEPNHTKIFVDQNGDFFPEDWKEVYGNHLGGRVNSLRKIASENNKKTHLFDFRKELLKQFQERVQFKERIIILVHGYNNKESQANDNFEAIKNVIKTDDVKDEVIEFYWDGLHANGIGSSVIWFNAVGYSQLAGEVGLRAVLNLLHNKEVILISHSRGASVVLSAISSPPYGEKFKRNTKNYHFIKLPKEPLGNNANEIKVVLLAPAVGMVDFEFPDRSKGLRDFSCQVKSMYVTINRKDPILKKFIGFISNKFNPTDLGYKPSTYNILEEKYPFLMKKEFKMKSHKFEDYIKHSSFKEMLVESGIEVNID